MKVSVSEKYFFGALLFTFFAAAAALNAGSLDTLYVKGEQRVKIDSIKISGNYVTKDFIIRRELTINEEDSVTEKIIDYNRERIFSLGLFTNVKLFVYRSNEKNVLIINVSESWYIYPLPFLRVQNSDLKKATYGVNLTYRNFRGRNETIRALIGFGYDPFYSLGYDNPALSYEDGLGLIFSLSYINSINKSKTAESIIGKNFTYKMYVQNFSLSKRFDQFNLAFITLGFNYIETATAKNNITASGERIDRFPFAGLSYYYDSRDLKQYSQNGLYVFTKITHNGFSINNISYNNFEIDFREYRKLFNELTGKWRINYRSTFGKMVPFYDYSYLGYYERVRGHYRDVREGKNYILTSFELSRPLVKELNISLKLPLLPEKLTSARIGIYLTSFFDAGDTFDNYKTLALNNFYYGFGFGITFLFLPYHAIRFEYALHEFWKGEFVIASGFSF